MQPNNDFAQEEERILANWKKNDIFGLVLKKNSPNGNFVFFEGPPTANAKPALHHVLARVYKDVILRYKTMQGYRVDRKAGWDTHGLPVELQVEKKLGISGKPQIETIVPNDVNASISLFNAECKKMVWDFLDEWNRLTERVGFWVDLEHPYVTYENQYIESVWFVFKQLYDKGLVYQSYKIVPYCSRCGTALSSHEVALGYKEVIDCSVFVKFEVVGEKNTYIVSWTTTPWTLPGNVALAVGEDIEYVYVATGHETLILAKNRMHILEGEKEIIRSCRGFDLVHLSYKPLFEIPSLVSETSYKVYSADFVTDSDGTGIVHTAVMYGEDDYALGEEIGLPQFHTVDESGNFVDEVGNGLSGNYVKDKATEQKIIEYLQHIGALMAQENYTHDYPFCWRCSTPLLYYARDSWFIRVSAFRDQLIKNNESVNWEPAHIRDGRFGEWLLQIRDWAISRERYWGTPMPIWQCESCEKELCVGSVAEIGITSAIELHRPYIDAVHITCECGGVMKRVSEVLDVWFDSGCMPIAQWGFPAVSGSEDALNTHYPADYIAEAIDQTRGWFYTLLSVATLLEKPAPYQNVICLGHILDSKGEKMSKSKGNVIDPWNVINEHGVDALRFHLFTMSAAGEPKKFDIQGVDQVKRRTLMILWNVVMFYNLYKHDVCEENIYADSVLDRWALTRLDQTISEVTKHLDSYDVTRAGRVIHDFITDISVWYIRRSRDRFKSHERGVANVLRHIVRDVARMMAPFTPFLAERIYEVVGGVEQSVHLSDWPEMRQQEIDDVCISTMQKVRDVCELGLRARATASIKIRQPLSRLSVVGVTFEDSFGLIIQEELNVKKIVSEKLEGDGIITVSEGSITVSLDTRISDELLCEGIAREIVRTVNTMRKDAGLSVGDRITLRISADPKLQEKLELHRSYICSATLADSWMFVDDARAVVLTTTFGEIGLLILVV